MTNQTQALRYLLVKVEAGERGIGLNTVSVFGNTQSAMDAVDAFDGSLDAAKVLHEAVLPGWKFGMHEPQPGIYRAYVCKWSLLRPMPTTYDAADPARAWLIAILRALIAQATP